MVSCVIHIIHHLIFGPGTETENWPSLDRRCYALWFGYAETVGFWFAIAKEKRDFKKYRREKAYGEIEDLKDSIGKLYELTANWKSHDSKAGEYDKAFINDHELIGKYNKYPEIAAAARDVVHWCKIVAFSERETRGRDLIENKKEKHREFLQACEIHLDKLT